MYFLPGEFPAQRASSAENVSYDDVIMNPPYIVWVQPFDLNIAVMNHVYHL